MVSWYHGYGQPQIASFPTSLPCTKRRAWRLGDAEIGHESAEDPTTHRSFLSTNELMESVVAMSFGYFNHELVAT